MKKYILLVASLLLLGACSSPKYAYNFDYHDYNSGKKLASTHHISPALDVEKISGEVAQQVDQTTLIASSKPEVFYPAENKPAAELNREIVKTKFSAMSKEQKKDIKSKIKTFIKESRKSEEVMGVQAKAAMGQDMKLAAIFGAVGIVLLIIGGDVLSIIGAVALLVGLYFFVRWLIHQ